ncbi:MAG: hypothetical protein KF729_18125 [Sandaracinaceae bacterium]|nr:hypothetical protein [Sandaracinaceae bacterium]
MKKPDTPIQSDPAHDYGLSERAARALERSPLHVYDTTVLSSLPREIGDPDDPSASMLVELTLVTDGARGWLVLVDEQTEWDAERETAELVAHVVRDLDAPPRFVVRAASVSRPKRPGTLDVRDPRRARSLLEGELERALDGAPPTDVVAFLRPFRELGGSVRGEGQIRDQMNGFG